LVKLGFGEEVSRGGMPVGSENVIVTPLAPLETTGSLTTPQGGSWRYDKNK